MIFRLTFVILCFLLLTGTHAQLRGELGIAGGAVRPRTVSCPRHYCTSDNYRCNYRPGIFMPCISYTGVVSYAACDCRLFIASSVGGIQG